MKLRFVKEAFPALHPGRSAAVYLGSKRIGFIGELHPKAAQAYELPHAPVVFEVEVPALLDRPLPNYVPVSKFQSVEVEKLFDAVAAAKKKDLRLAPLANFKLFDLYRPQDAVDTVAEKSLAFAIELSSRTEEALTDEQADGAVRAILEALEGVGAHLRA